MLLVTKICWNEKPEISVNILNLDFICLHSAKKWCIHMTSLRQVNDGDRDPSAKVVLALSNLNLKKGLDKVLAALQVLNKIPTPDERQNRIQIAKQTAELFVSNPDVAALVKHLDDL